MKIFYLLFLPILSYGAIDFEKEIKPIFEAKCTKCHGAKKDKGGLALHNKLRAFKESDSGEAVIIPRKAEASLLLKKLLETDEDEVMPPKGPLKKEQIELIKQWIAEGAKWPDDGSKEEVNWSLKKITLPKLPTIKNKKWPANSIDHFTLAKMEIQNSSPALKADPQSLIRRVYLDLTGQLPELDTIAKFKAAPTEDHYTKIVDSLLASKSYGEHWATHWLDLARYADSDGYQRDRFRDVYAYRNWVIKAFNNDKPFDQFTIEQLAGDLLPNPSIDQLTATGFNRGSTINLEAGTDVEHDRIKQVMERVDVMGTVFLGSSLSCAKCHNHKYDPFTIKDYYSFMAFFNNTKIESKIGKGKDRTIEYIGSNMKIFAQNQNEQSFQKALEAKKQHEKKFIAKVSELEKATKKTNLKKKNKTLNFRQCSKLHKNKYKKNVELNSMMSQIQLQNKIITENTPTSTRVMEELPQMRETRIFLRGEHTTPGKKVTPKTPSFLHKLPENEPINRLGLAKWLVSQENPLMARAVVNRWWAEFFGKGLSITLEDLGKQGNPPSHPQLLNWLATEFKKNWSRKKIHRLIVMSQTYRQSTVCSEKKRQNDPSNFLYNRTTPLRLKAETIRDTILQISGLLSKKMFGKPVKPTQPTGIWRVIGNVDNTYKTSTGEDRYRKGIYTIWRRSAHYPSFANFDAPDRGTCTVKRSRSNTPMQALTLLNDKAFVEAAKSFAKKIITLANNDHQRLIKAFLLCTSRTPNQQELTILKDILKRERLKKRQVYDPWFTIASVLINMHETITRR